MKLINIIENVKFFFNKPNYKVGNTIRFWNETYKINGIKRDWKFSTFMYKLEGSDIEPSEDLLKFYLIADNRKRY